MTRYLKAIGLVAILMNLFCGPALAHTPRFAVISDPHFYDTDLGISGSAFETYLAHDRKMLRESEAILKAALEKIKAERPDFLIIPGDLTKDGELSSHTKLSGYLEDLEREGIEVFVVPGNHDINNPHAVSFEGDQMTPVANVSPDQFAEIYARFGYDQAIFRDPASLSYVAEPVKGVWLFGIDSCRYTNNLTEGHPTTGGALSQETLGWIKKRLAEARRRHKTVVGFMHHGVLEHYTGQTQLFSDHVIENWQKVSQTLAGDGMNLIFTGHFHAHDITKKQGVDDLLYDIETGSLVTYPSPFRMVDLHGRNAAVVRSFRVDAIDADTGGIPFAEYSQTFLYQGLVGLSAYQLQGTFGFSESEAKIEAPHVAQAFMAHYAGDESPDSDTQQRIRDYTSSSDPRYVSLGQALYALWTDLTPRDNSAALALDPAISIAPVGTYATGTFNEGAAEIAAYDSATKTLFVVNGADQTVDLLDVSDPARPSLFNSIDITAYGASPNSVAFNHGLLAVAVEADPAQDPGKVVFFNASGAFLKAFTVGALPDMLTFTPDGRHLLVANEGEPNDDYTSDPEGSVSIIDLSRGLSRAKVKTADFRRFNKQKQPLLAKGVRIFGPGATVAMDLEPEYIAVFPHQPLAWVTLQENNAVARIDIRSGKVIDILPLAYKKHGLAQNGLDASDKDDHIHIASYGGLLGMIQPDAVSAYGAKGGVYLVTANEGDARDYEAFSEEARIKDLVLDPKAFPDADVLQQNDILGRLKVTATLGDRDGDGDYDRLYAFGGRSFSIFKNTAKGLAPIFDSQDQFEQIVAAALPHDFNSDNAENDSFDSRSDDKGPEPEGLAVGTIGHRTYAFIGLERVGGIMVYDITSPGSPQFVQYVNHRDFSADAEDPTAGDLGPEGIAFIQASKSPTGKPMLAVANEVSGTTTLYRIDVPTDRN